MRHQTVKAGVRSPSGPGALREACGHCAGFIGLIAAGAAAWVAIAVVCSRIIP